MSIPRLFKSLYSTATSRLASSRSRSNKRNSHRPLLEALEDRTVMFNPYGNGAVWGTTDLTYSYNNLLDPWTPLPVGERIAAVEESMGAWTAVSPLRIVELPDPAPGVSDGNYDPSGYPIFRWGHHFIDGTPPLPTPTNPNRTHVLAHGFQPGTNGINGDMHFDNGDAWTVNDFLQVGTHEFGHALGLDHANGDVVGNMCPPPFAAIMHACLGGGGTWSFNGLGTASLEADDIAGIRSLYGAGLGYVLNLSGELHVYGTQIRNVFTVQISRDTVSVTSEGNGSFTRSLNGIRSVFIHGQEGNDEIRLRGAGTIRTVLDGGDGSDEFFIEAGQSNLNNEIVVNGGAGLDNLTVAPDLGKVVTFDGGADGDLLIVGNVPASSVISVVGASVTVQTGGRNTRISSSDIQRISTLGDSRDTVNLLSVRSGLPISVFGAGTVSVPRLDAMNEVVNVFGEGATNLTITDANTSAPGSYQVNEREVRATLAGSEQRIRYEALRSMTIQGGGGGNEFTLSNTPAAPVTLNSGRGEDRVWVLGTSGPLTIHGEDSRIAGRPDGFDTVSIGFLGSIQSIRNGLTLTNDGAYTAVNVDNSRDTVARTGIIYRNNTRLSHDLRVESYTVIQDLIPRENIVLRTRDLRSLTVRAGTPLDGNGNTFRIHDTPTSNAPGGVTTTLSTGDGPDSVLVTGTRGALVLNPQGGYNAITVGSTTAGQDTITGAISIRGAGGTSVVTINDRPSAAGRNLTHTITAAAYSRTGSATVSLSDIHSLFLLAGSAHDAVHVQGNPTRQLFAGFDILGGAGNDTFNIGNAANQLAGIGSFLTIDGETGSDTLNLHDQGSTVPKTYTFGLNFGTVPVFSSPDAAITHFNAEAVLLNGGSGGSFVAVAGTPVGSTLTVNGSAGASDRFEVSADANAIRGQVFLRGQSGDEDFATYEDGPNTAPHAYTLTNRTISRASLAGNPDLAQVVFSGLARMVLYAPRVGGSTVNVRSVEAPVLALVAADRDTVNISSLNRRLNNISGSVAVRSYSLEDQVRLIVDDSGNAALTPKNIRLTPPVSPTDLGNHIEGFARNTLYWDLGSNASVALLGGAADEAFAPTSTAFAAAISIDGGGGVNTLDYSAITGGSPPPLPGIVSSYRGEGNAADSTGGNHGTIVGDVAFVPGQVGQAFDFDALDGILDYVDLGSDASLDLPGSMSVSLWVRLDTLNHYKFLLADFDSPNGSTSQGALGTDLFGSVFAWYQSYTDGTRDVLTGTTPIQFDQWFHLSVVRDDDAKTVRLYINGVEEASLSYADKTVVPLQSSKFLGGSGPAYPADFIDGQLDEVGIYNRALSLAEIQALGSAGGTGDSSGVVVNLLLGTATGLTGGIAGIRNVIGSAGNDILVGNVGNMLIAGAGHDLLIAGGSASTLNGGDGDDILIGGTTDFDANPTALRAILDEWVRMRTTSVLNADTVQSNRRANRLTGGADADLFFALLALELVDLDEPNDAWVQLL